ncbi:hypothetical protein GCM10011375_37820 [Hymenobacter qilianensis]|uniref:Uncharacterized protein n=1 Tax=Hymenobacter qilianensis TaxID=1385715 RepID=A0ACB5PWJ0_9BACT|nr:hypothetical protein [Hymenobacter qilianensis]GGF79239.1 hypothetical protein GCM10011375_37820 [Hymenobacter qilianensis]
MYSPLSLPTRTITFRPDLNVLVVRWHTHAAVEVVQADYAQMLDAAEASRCTDWLLDVRRREAAPAALSAWVSHVFYPGAVARLSPHRLRMAVLSSPSLTELYRTDPEHQKHVAYSTDPARPYDIRLFDDEGQAMHWLSTRLR